MAKYVLLVLLSNFLDIMLATLLLFRTKWTLHSWLVAVSDLNFCTTLIDLWLLAISRFALIAGAVIGTKMNPAKSCLRLRRCRRIIFFLTFGIVVYDLVKLLASTECGQTHRKKRFFWLFLGHTFFFSIVMSWNWWMLGKPHIVSGQTLSVNADHEVCPVLNEDSCSSISDDESESDEAGSISDNSKRKSKVTIFRLLSVSKPDTHMLCFAFIFLLCAAFGEMFMPYFTGKVIDSIAIERDNEKFQRFIVVMTMVSAITAVCTGLRGGIFQLVMSRFNIRVNKQLFDSIVRQEIAFFDKTRTGEIVSRLTSDTEKMGEQVSLNINVFLRNLVTAMGVCAFMFHISWKLSIVTLISIPIVAVISEIYGKYFQKLSEKVQNSIAKANEVAEEVISSMKTVRSFANEDGVVREYSTKLDKTYALNKKEALVYGGYASGNYLLETITSVITLYYGGHLVMRGEMSGGNLVSFLLYSLSLGNAIEGIGDVYTGLVDAVGAAEKVFRYIDRKPKMPNNGVLTPSKFTGRVEFKNVSFTYPSRSESPVLEDVSFVIEQGETVALVGPSGAGKSTCINLLQHFYEPDAGEILFDGVAVGDIDHKFLHQQIALVGQEPVLFARTLKENIAYNFEAESDMDELITEAARLANAHDFIVDLSRGYNTQAGEKGQQLSGGQKQRIAIARALIRKPSILLFDEATSALDAASENKIQEAMFTNLKGRTLIIIAHRLSTIEKADRIIVMEHGKIAEVGTHAQLMAKEGTYAKLVRHQLVNSEKGFT